MQRSAWHNMWKSLNMGEIRCFLSIQDLPSGREMPRLRKRDMLCSRMGRLRYFQAPLCAMEKASSEYS